MSEFKEENNAAQFILFNSCFKSYCLVIILIIMQKYTLEGLSNGQYWNIFDTPVLSNSGLKQEYGPIHTFQHLSIWEIKDTFSLLPTISLGVSQ